MGTWAWSEYGCIDQSNRFHLQQDDISKRFFSIQCILWTKYCARKSKQLSMIQLFNCLLSLF